MRSEESNLATFPKPKRLDPTRMEEEILRRLNSGHAIQLGRLVLRLQEDPGETSPVLLWRQLPAHCGADFQ